MIVIGSGMAGLLAGGMIRNQKVTIYESASSLPNNHSAVLRFRSTVVGDTLGIEFKPVQMIKTVHNWKNPVADSLAYAQKCTGEATLRSILSADSTPQWRFIAPEDLVETMSKRVNGEIAFNKKVTAAEIFKSGSNIISTMPMPTLMKLLNYPVVPKFRAVNGYNINSRLQNVNAYASIYIPDPQHPFSRISITGDKLTIEIPDPSNKYSDAVQLTDQAKKLTEIAAGFFGIEWPEFSELSVSNQKYSKILPIDESARRKFIMWASENHRVYSLGRFATWRPGLLLDDIVKDVRVIQNIIKNGSYDHKKKG